MPDPTITLYSKHSSVNPLLNSPSHVTLLFVLILLAVFGVIVSGLFNIFAPCAVPLLVIALVFPFRDLIAWVDDTRARYATSPYPALQDEVNALGRELGLKFIPQIEQTNSTLGIFTIGSLRRSLIIGNKDVLNWLVANLASSDISKQTLARVILYHELQHISQKDLRRLGFARQLLVVIFKWAVWGFLFVLGFFLLLAILGIPLMKVFSDPTSMQTLAGGDPSMSLFLSSIFPSSQEANSVLNKVPSIPIWPFLLVAIMGFFPMFLSTVFMWLFLLRRMFRLREYYADAACVSRFGEEAVSKALSDLAIQLAYPTATSSNSPKISRFSFVKVLQSQWDKATSMVARLIPAHDALRARLVALNEPTLAVFDPGPTGITIGLAALLVEFFLMSSLILLVVGQWPAHVTTLIIFAAFSVATKSLAAQTSLALPQLYKRVIKSLFIACLIANIYNILNYGLDWAALTFAPIQTLRFLEMAISPFTRLFHQFVEDDFVETLRSVVSGSVIAILTGVALSCLAVILDLKIMRTVQLKLNDPKATQRWGWLLMLAITSWLSFLLCLISAMVFNDSDKLTDIFTILSGLSAFLFTGWAGVSYLRFAKIDAISPSEEGL